MAGQGKRFSHTSPKQFQLLAGKKIYLWTLEQFSTSNLFEEIILVCEASLISEIQAEVGPSHRVIAGGATRQESSYEGILACGPNTEIVVIHDAVRPFVSHRILQDNVNGARKFGAVDTCIPSHDTLVHCKDGKTIAEIPKRSEYLRGQTPQSFAYTTILSAHKQAKTSDATDDCRLVLDQNVPIHLVEGEERNMKITTPLDLTIAELLMK